MSNEQTTPEATPTAPGATAAQQNLKVHEVPEVLEFLRQNGISLLVGVGLAVAVFLGVSAYRNYKKSAASTAFDLLFRSQTPDQFQQILTQYGSTPAAPLAQLAMASAQFDQGQYELAGHLFMQFQAKYPDHPFTLQAVLGQAQCKEAAGQLEEALAAYEQFAASHPDHYLQPVALFGKARTLEQMGRFAESRAVYEDFIALGKTNSPWTARAEAALLYVDKEARAAQLPQPAAAAPTLPPMTLGPTPGQPDFPMPAP